MSALAYFEALGLTELVEAPIYGAILTLGCRTRVTSAVVASILVNLVSHPLFTFMFMPVAGRALSPPVAVMAGEIVVCVLEAALIYLWLRRDLPTILAASLLANACSFGAGLLLL